MNAPTVSFTRLPVHRDLAAGDNCLRTETVVDSSVANGDGIESTDRCDCPWRRQLNQQAIAGSVRGPNAYEHSGHWNRGLADVRPARNRALVIDERHIPADGRGRKPRRRPSDDWPGSGPHESDAPHDP